MRYLLVGLLLLAGCSPAASPTQSPTANTPSTPGVAASPSPSPTCSPIGGTASPCSPEEYAEVEAQNKRVNEAIAVYRRWEKESNRLYRTGGTTKVTPEMAATTDGDFRKSVLSIFTEVKRGGIRATTGQVKIATLVAAPTSPVEITLNVCRDGRSLEFKRAGKTISRGVIAVEDIVAKRSGDVVKLWSVKSEVVTSCPA